MKIFLKKLFTKEEKETINEEVLIEVLPKDEQEQEIIQNNISQKLDDKNEEKIQTSYQKEQIQLKEQKVIESNEVVEKPQPKKRIKKQA